MLTSRPMRVTNGLDPRWMVACYRWIEGAGSEMDDGRATDLLDRMVSSGRGLATLEVRWIRPGPLPQQLVDRLMPAPQEIELREDHYLIAPLYRDLSVKVRGGVQLDVKVYRGTPGQLNIPGAATGGMEVWVKWAAPLRTTTDAPSDESWLAVRKLRRKRSFAVIDGEVVERPGRTAGTPGCTVELTEVQIANNIWWTLGLESGGPPEQLERDLTSTAALLLQRPVPDMPRLDERDSMSYVELLRRGSLGLSDGLNP